MLLPKKIDIDRAKADTRQREIEEGMNLARKVDEIRKLRVEQEVALKQWKEVTLKQAQQEIDEKVKERDSLLIEIARLNALKEEAQKPLTDEWNMVRNEKETLSIQRKEIEKEAGELLQAKKIIVKQEEDIKLRLVQLQKDEQSIQQLKADIEKDRTIIRNEREQSQSIRERNEYERNTFFKEAESIKKQYEVALKTIEVREQQVEQKEKDLVKREQTLQRRIKNLQKA